MEIYTQPLIEHNGCRKNLWAILLIHDKKYINIKEQRNLSLPSKQSKPRNISGPTDEWRWQWCRWLGKEAVANQLRQNWPLQTPLKHCEISEWNLLKGIGFPSNTHKSPEGFHPGATAEVENHVLKPLIHKKMIYSKDISQWPPPFLL